jgi:hypothetical protein
VESIQRRIDTVNRQLKPLSKNCVKKVHILPENTFLLVMSS